MTEVPASAVSENGAVYRRQAHFARPNVLAAPS
jgi:hypothetical protein